MEQPAKKGDQICKKHRVKAISHVKIKVFHLKFPKLQNFLIFKAL